MLMKEKEKTYQDVFNSYTKNEVALIAQLKRLREIRIFDTRFETLLKSDPQNPYIKEKLSKSGITFATDDIIPLLNKEVSQAIVMFCRDTNLKLEDHPDLENELKKYPIALLWVKWLKETASITQKAKGVHTFVEKNPKFDTWRKRRIASAKSELGHFGNIIDHPIFAYELNKGCSVGCRFCAFSSQKLSAIFEYTEANRKFWREILQVGVDLFGKASKQGLCYYGTEPADNPNYLDFIKDFQEITKGITCTSTAAPLKNIEKFRELLKYYRNYNMPWPQVSILTESMAKKLHETFTPEELFEASLVDKTANTDELKAVSGKTLNWKRNKTDDIQKRVDDFEFIPQASISCVTGFLVNMIDHSIQLISPCKASEKNPFGYRIFAEDSFTDAKDYRKKIERIIEKHMKDNVESDTILAFRDDLSFEISLNGFKLKSLYQTHHVSGDSSIILLGTLIAEKRLTYHEISTALREKGGNALVVSSMVKNFHTQGFLDETIF